jgi:hypothetical protein
MLCVPIRRQYFFSQKLVSLYKDAVNVPQKALAKKLEHYTAQQPRA